MCGMCPTPAKSRERARPAELGDPPSLADRSHRVGLAPDQSGRGIAIRPHVGASPAERSVPVGEQVRKPGGVGQCGSCAAASAPSGLEAIAPACSLRAIIERSSGPVASWIGDRRRGRSLAPAAGSPAIWRRRPCLNRIEPAERRVDEDERAEPAGMAQRELLGGRAGAEAVADDHGRLAGINPGEHRRQPLRLGHPVVAFFERVVVGPAEGRQVDGDDPPSPPRGGGQRPASRIRPRRLSHGSA